MAALHAPTGGIICPFGLTIALAENAAINGVELYLNTEVQRIEKTPGGYRLNTSRGTFDTKVLVNAAGYQFEPYGGSLAEVAYGKQNE